MERLIYANGCSFERELNALLGTETEVFVLMDSKVAPFLKSRLTALCPKKKEILLLEATEETKSVETAVQVVRWLQEHGSDRDILLLGAGGGVITDLTGFVASIYLRGVRYALIPTTLLAQVDAAVGGKTGVNLDDCKNVIGTFNTPEWVLFNDSVLSTLPERERLSGLAEAIKTFIIGDAQMFKALSCSKSRDGSSVSLTEIVQHSVAVKKNIVQKDRTEQGLRRKLNLGHTIGHALESLSFLYSLPLTHGEAVAAGIMAAAEISVREGILNRHIRDHIANTLNFLGYRDMYAILQAIHKEDRTEITDKIMQFIAKDKKRKEDFINFVLIQDIGDVIVKSLSFRKIQEVVDDLC